MNQPLSLDLILKNKKMIVMHIYVCVCVCICSDRGRINCIAYLGMGRSGGLLLVTSITNKILCKLFNFFVSSDKL